VPPCSMDSSAPFLGSAGFSCSHYALQFVGEKAIPTQTEEHTLASEANLASMSRWWPCHTRRAPAQQSAVWGCHVLADDVQALVQSNAQ